MNTTCGIILSVLMSFSAASAVTPSPCGKSGMTALRADDGSGFLFYVFREGPDLYFALTGEQLSFPDGLSGPRTLLIDGILYESLLVKPAAFMKVEKGAADLDVLKKHQAYEVEHMLKTPTPLRKFVELGPREKASANGQPSFTFFLWKAEDPSAPEGTRQYFLTTVSAGEVVVLSAIVRDQSKESAAMRAFQSYASSFQHVLRREDCPEQSK